MFRLQYDDPQAPTTQWTMEFNEGFELTSLTNNCEPPKPTEFPVWLIERLLRFGPDLGCTMARSVLQWQFKQWNRELNIVLKEKP